MTEWQGAMGLAQLTRLAAQTAVRERNATYLANRLAEVPGVAPLWRDPRVTRWGFYFWHFKFLPEHWNGVTCAQFRRALAAEGVSCGTGHTQPLYQHPLFAGREAVGGKEHPPTTPDAGQDCRLQAHGLPGDRAHLRDRGVLVAAPPLSRSARRYGPHPRRYSASCGRTKTSCAKWRSEPPPGASKTSAGRPAGITGDGTRECSMTGVERRLDLAEIAAAVG